MKTKAIHIDAENKVIKEIELDSLEDMQAAVGGLIELAVAAQHENGDLIDLYVNDEGMINGTDFGFAIEDSNGNRQKFYGNGLVCGSNDTGIRTDSPVSVDEVESRVLWCASKQRIATDNLIKDNRLN